MSDKSKKETATADPEIAALEQTVAKLREVAAHTSLDVEEEVTGLTTKLNRMKRGLVENRSAWDRIKLARHPGRPHTLDLVAAMASDHVELKGDRSLLDDAAVAGGFATIQGRAVLFVGHQKGHDTKENLARNFGMPNPEGIRKGLRLMKLAEKFRLPVVTFLDTAGAFPGLSFEERGGAEAIGRNIREMATLSVPIVVCVIGEGGSGGALAFGAGDRILMLENAYYSVISPEGCAAILHRDEAKKPGVVEQVAEKMKLTAKDLLALGVVDEIVPEPPEGAHKDPAATAASLSVAILRALGDLSELAPDALRQRRYAKFRAMGVLA